MHPLEKLRDEFSNATKTVLKENIPKNIETLNKNRDRITKSYNNLTLGIKNIYSTESIQNQDILKNWLEWARAKVVRSYEVLNCDYYVPENFDIISSLVINSPKLEIVTQTDSDEDSEATENPILQEQLIDNIQNMAELTPVDVLKLVSSTINKNFSGDPLALQSFIDSVNLLRTIVTSAALQNTLKQCILSKLEGKARECINAEPGTVDEIVNSLRTNIKTEKSQVIEGRMQALKADRVPLQDFSQKAEELAENFRRALVMEGIPSDKAREMTVEKTVQMCRASARSDLTKSVLASTTFHDAKDVVAKFVIEINEESKEKQVLAFQRNNKINFGTGSTQNRNNRNFNLNHQQFNQNRSNFRHNPNNNNRHNRRNYNNNFQNNNRYPSRFNNNNYQPHIRYLENQSVPQDPNANQLQGFLGDNQQ